MKIQKYIPSYPLSHYIQNMLYLTGYVPIRFMKQLPDGKINLVIELVESTLNTVYTETGFKGKYVMKNAWITGIQPRPIIYENKKNSTVLSVQFTTGGFFALTGIPITEIDHVGIEAEAIFGNSFKDLYQNLLNASCILEIFKLSENYFLKFAKRGTFENSIVKFMDNNIEKPLDWLVNRSGYSHKHVIHMIRTHTGFTPKYLQRLYRFQKVIAAIQAQKKQIDWTSISHGYGYYDQAHFIKEFTYFSDITPTEYLKSRLLQGDGDHLIPAMILQSPI